MSWAKVDDQFHAHRKAKRAWKGHPRALGLHLLAISYCAGHLTDGLVDPEFVEEKVPNTRERGQVTTALEAAGLWAPEDGGWRINDWLDFNPSRAEVLDRRRRDAARKQRGRREESEESPRGRHAESEQDSRARASRPDPTHPDQDSSDDESARASTVEERNSNPEYARLADLLAELIVENGSKGPTPAEAEGWQNDVRLMVERDGRTVDGIERAIRWAQADTFWRSNVLSMGKLRKQWDTMRLQAEREKAPRPGPRDRAGLRVVAGGTCRRCDSEVSAYQANNQSGLCDGCYAKHVEGEAA